MILAFELDLDSVKVNHRAIHLPQRSFYFGSYCPDTQTYIHTAEKVHYMATKVVGNKAYVQII